MSGVTGDLEFVGGALTGGTVVQRWYPALDWNWGDIDPALALCAVTRTLLVGEPRACGSCDWAYTYALSEPAYDGAHCDGVALDPERPAADAWLGYDAHFGAPYEDYAGHPDWYLGTLVGPDGMWPGNPDIPFYPTQVEGDATLGITFHQFAFWDDDTVFTWD